MIPFLEEGELHQLAMKVAQAPEGNYQGVTLKDLLPFLEEEDVDALMLGAIQRGEDISSCLPFASEEGLSKLIDSFLQGAPLKNPKRYLPFLEEEDVSKIAVKVVENGGEYQGLTLANLLPFLDDDEIDDLFLQALKKGDIHISEMAPFVSEEALHKAVMMFVQGEIDEHSIDAIYPYLEDEDIHVLFTQAMK